jgi:thiamine-monophosphate kinase
VNEFELIARLTASLPGNASVVVGPGDDCAVLECGSPDSQLLLKTDAVVENVHFTPDTPPQKIGRKAIARCLSDVAAMAGTPVSALVTLGLPAGFDPERIAEIYSGMSSVAQQFGVAIVGGETTRSPGALWISIAITGTVGRGKAVLRSGAKPGDAIFVTGELGGSLSGRHLEFEPRVIEAQWLAEHFQIHAMMDVSDGLAGDLRHLLRSSKAGAEILKRAVPISREARLAAKAGDAAKPAFVAALTDGEDFELLFTVASHHAVPLLDAWKRQFPKLKLSCIGKIVSGDGLRLRDDRGVRELTVHGHVHFS